MSEGGKKVLRHSDGETVHFGGDVVALEKDKMFKRMYVSWEYSMFFFFVSPPLPVSKNAFEGCRLAVE